ncbi:cleavage and polyadenylation specificity factor subunit 2 [Citrus sinensis]|nr:cleavage and polyadenylation specificity factor subunit 2 [Citrus sinensis]
MGTSVQVTPLSGVFNENPLSYLVSIDGFNFLIDCGWNDHFDPSLLQPLSKVASTIDAVLLSHPDTLHLGALPYAMKQLGLSAPVFSTEPVYRLGLLTMYDQYLSRRQVSEFDLFTLDDIDSAFQSVTRLTYSQNYHLSGEGIVVAPHVAGHLLGGTVWKITKDGEDVIYAVDYNRRKEKHLNGTVLESFVRPAVLITDAYNALHNQPPRQQREMFQDAISKTLRAGGNVLLPVDSAGRVLELLLILEDYWAEHSLNYPIYFLTYVSSSTIDYVKSFLEWMGDSITKSFETSRDNAFLLKHVTLLINKSELDNAPDGPKLVLASMASLEAGFSHDIFVEWASDVKNLVLFTERGQFGTLARMLQADPPPKAVKVTMSRRVPLVGEELIAYEEEQTRLKKEEALKASLVKEEESKASLGPDNNLSGDPMVIDANNANASADVVEPHGGRYRDILIDGFVPPSTSVAPMFPFYENNSEWDDFGEVINPDDYIIKDEDMDQAAMHIGGDDGKLDEGSASLILDAKPSKVVQVKCLLIFIDYEGRADGRSIKTILSHVAPLKLVLVHGSAEATEHLKQHCLKHVCPHVYTPQIEETIDVTSDLCAYKVQLSEKLMSNVLFKKLGDYEIAWVDAEVGKTENGMLSLLPISTPAPPHKSVLVGDLKMADLKPFLSSKGIQVEFAGGALRCGEYVTIRKVGPAGQKDTPPEGFNMFLAFLLSLDFIPQRRKDWQSHWLPPIGVISLEKESW